MTNVLLASATTTAPRKPRIGFLGVGWIGRHRMEAMLVTGAVEAAAVVDPCDDMVRAALTLAPDASRLETLDALLEQNLDGVVIATPSALHAEQSIRALKRGVAVFCQKPLARDEAETRTVIEAARQADRLLGVDFSYRHTEAARQIRRLLQAGDLGRIFAVDLTFHNAYGPDKPWFYDPLLSGGGCVIDLGVHLVDLVLWLLEGTAVADVSSSLHAGGHPLSEGGVEDYAVATLTLDTGAVVRLACSWRLAAGQDAIIAASFYGDAGSAELRNINGSFYDFTAEQFTGAARSVLAVPPDSWGGRAAADWARRLATGARFDPEVEQASVVARVLDRIYGR